MKIKKIEKQNNKLIQMQILKAYYKKKSVNFKNNLNQIKIHLNKISNIVYKYHITDKKILLLGFPTSFIKTIENTKHILIPEFLWFNGMLNNRINEKNNMPLNTFKLIRKLKRKVDLIIIANFSEKATAIKESYISRIPVITMNKKLNILNFKTTYNLVGNYNRISDKMELNNLFFSFIKTTLNRAKKSKKVKIYKNLKTLKQNYKKIRPYKKFKSFKNK
jgi:hypothetical protein